MLVLLPEHHLLQHLQPPRQPFTQGSLWELQQPTVQFASTYTVPLHPPYELIATTQPVEHALSSETTMVLDIPMCRQLMECLSCHQQFPAYEKETHHACLCCHNRCNRRCHE